MKKIKAKESKPTNDFDVGLMKAVIWYKAGMNNREKVKKMKVPYVIGPDFGEFEFLGMEKFMGKRGKKASVINLKIIMHNQMVLKCELNEIRDLIKKLIK